MTYVTDASEVHDVIETVDMPAAGDAERLWRDGCPRRFADATFGDLDTPVGDAAGEWLDGGGRNLLLLGHVGVGKTHAALAAARRWIHWHERAWWFVPMPELLDQIRPSGSHPDAAMQRAISVPLLVLDDLGGERPTDWTLERLFVVVNRRWLEGRPIIATSNLAVDNGQGPLVDFIGERTYSRLVGDAVVVQMAGRDLRRVV